MAPEIETLGKYQILEQIGRGGFFGFDLGWSPDAHLDFTTALSLAY